MYRPPRQSPCSSIPALLVITLWLVRGQTLRRLNGLLLGVLALGLLAGAAGLSRGDFALSLTWGGLTGVGLLVYVTLSPVSRGPFVAAGDSRAHAAFGGASSLAAAGHAGPGVRGERGGGVGGAGAPRGALELRSLRAPLHPAHLAGRTPRTTAVASAEPVAAGLTLAPFLAGLPWLGLLAAGCVLGFALMTRTRPKVHAAPPLDTRTKKRLLRARVHGVSPDARYSLEGWLKG